MTLVGGLIIKLARNEQEHVDIYIENNFSDFDWHFKSGDYQATTTNTSTDLQEAKPRPLLMMLYYNLVNY